MALHVFTRNLIGGLGMILIILRGLMEEVIRFI